MNLKPVASHTRPTIPAHISFSLSSSPPVETRVEQEITPVWAFSQSSAVNCSIDRMRSASSGSPVVSGYSSSHFRFLFLCRSCPFAVQEMQQDDGSPRAPFLWFLLHSGNWSLGLLLLQSQQRRSGSCSMVAEGILGSRRTLAKRSLNSTFMVPSATTSVIVMIFNCN